MAIGSLRSYCSVLRSGRLLYDSDSLRDRSFVECLDDELVLYVVVAVALLDGGGRCDDSDRDSDRGVSRVCWRLFQAQKVSKHPLRTCSMVCGLRGPLICRRRSLYF